MGIVDKLRESKAKSPLVRAIAFCVILGNPYIVYPKPKYGKSWLYLQMLRPPSPCTVWVSSPPIFIRKRPQFNPGKPFHNQHHYF